MMITERRRLSVADQRERDELIVKLARQNVSTPNICSQLRTNAKTVQRVLREAGLSRRRVTWTPERIAQAQALLADGAHYSEVDRTLRIAIGSTASKFPGQSKMSMQDLIDLQNDTGERAHFKPSLRRPAFLDVEPVAPSPRGTPFRT